MQNRFKFTHVQGSKYSQVMGRLFDRRCFWMGSRGSLGALKELNLTTVRDAQDKGVGSLALNRSSSLFCLEKVTWQNISVTRRDFQMHLSQWRFWGCSCDHTAQPEGLCAPFPYLLNHTEVWVEGTLKGLLVMTRDIFIYTGLLSAPSNLTLIVPYPFSQWFIAFSASHICALEELGVIFQWSVNSFHKGSRAVWKLACCLQNSFWLQILTFTWNCFFSNWNIYFLPWLKKKKKKKRKWFHITWSYHRITEYSVLEGTLKGHPAQLPCNEQGHLQLDQFGQCSDPLECFQGGEIWTGSTTSLGTCSNGLPPSFSKNSILCLI